MENNEVLEDPEVLYNFCELEFEDGSVTIGAPDGGCVDVTVVDGFFLVMRYEVPSIEGKPATVRGYRAGDVKAFRLVSKLEGTND